MNKKRVAIVCILISFLSWNLQAQEDSFEKERLRRTRMDFNRTETEVLQYIRKYIPDVTDTQIKKWEDEKALEYLIFDGEKRYFRNAAPNLFRIDSVCRAIKQAKDITSDEGSLAVNKTHVPEIMEEVRKTGKSVVLPKRMRVKYTLTVKADVVPEGKTIRCWLPLPRTDAAPRQTEVKLLSASEPDYIIAPDSFVHHTLYLEKKAVKGKPTTFSTEFEYISSGEWHRLTPEKVKPYKTDDPLYRKYTAERESHIIFTPEIKALAKKLVGDETNPWRKAQRIYAWVDRNFPWASAREYSTIPNIPQYVLENEHGDCGQVSLLFITLARCSGIPAKWQSGFMMHPGLGNLHDWAQAYFEGIGWVPVDESFGLFSPGKTEEEIYFFANGIDSYRMIVNEDYSGPLFPEKKFPRSETVDFQRGEVEWEGGNLYFNQWNYDFDITYLTDELRQIE